MRKADKPIVVNQFFNCSSINLWSALTELEKMKQWFFENIPAFKAEVGFKTQFNVVSENRNFLHLWEIVEVVPAKKIVYSWKYKDYHGSALVIFELQSNNSKTLLTLTNIVLKDFPENVPEFKTESCVTGWEYFIKNRLKTYLQNIKK